MFLINPIATVVAIIISYGIYFYLDQRSVESAWGNVRRGIWLTAARSALLALEGERYHVKNWRPNLLVFTGQPHNREHLATLANWLSAGQGIVTFYQLLVGDPENVRTNGLGKSARKQIHNFIAKKNIKAFADVNVVRDFYSGALTVAQTHGLGGLKPNIILMGLSDEPQGRISQLELVNDLLLVGKSSLLFRHDTERSFGEYRCIDIWWNGRDPNGALMVLLAHVIKQHSDWRSAKIRLLRIIPNPEGSAPTQAHLEKLLTEVRVKAEAVVVIEPERGVPIEQTIAQWSKDADLTFLGMQKANLENVEGYYQHLDKLLAVTGTTLMVRSAWDDDLLNID